MTTYYKHHHFVAAEAPPPAARMVEWLTREAMSSRREKSSDGPVVERWCTASMVPLLVLGLCTRTWPIIFASLASVLSHAQPCPLLLYLDYVGVGVMVGWIGSLWWTGVYTFGVCWSPEHFLIPCDLFLLAGMLNVVDTLHAQHYGLTWRTTLYHVLWHLSATLAVIGILL